MPSPNQFSVDRITAPPADVFRREYLDQQKPVIMTGLFADHPIAQVTSEEQAHRDLGWLRIPVGAEYTSAIARSGKPQELETMRLDEYLDMQRTHPGTLRMCSEQPTPAPMLAKFKLPDYDTFEDSISSFFVGQAGQFANMHFDGDFRHVLFHQVFGTKRFIFIPPVRNRLIPVAGNLVEWSIQNMSDEEINRVLTFTGGYDCMLHAGETLFIPASIWHYVGYTTTSMSFNIRFGRNAFTRFLSQNLHMTKFVQSIAWRMSNVASIAPEAHKQYRRIVDATEAAYSSPEERYVALDKLAEDVSDILDDHAKPQGMVNSDRFRSIYRDAAVAKYAAIEEQKHKAVEQDAVIA